jgi:aerobic carbon-monoxide dehydrogenase small subunit
MTEPSSSRSITVEVNGTSYTREVEARRLLVHLIRDGLDLTGTHIGCDTGSCGACTVHVNGLPVKSCMMLAVQADGATIATVEGLAANDELTALQQAFSDKHALQCGYCTPGMLVTARDIVMRLPDADEARIRKELSGNLCRCTGYMGIVRAIQRVLRP